MRKRFISAITAFCIVGVLITNMITSASASVTAAVVGASVAGSLLLGSLFNQMCGGQGYDFTNAFQDAVKLYTDWEEDFDGSAKDPIHPVTKVEIDTSKVNIPDNIDFNSVGGTSADKMIVEMQKAINEGLEDGSIEISFDEDGNLSMPTTSWCNSVTDIYDRLGVLTSKNGTSRSLHSWILASQYIDRVYYENSVTVIPFSDFSEIVNGWSGYFLPFLITKDGDLQFLKLGYHFTCDRYWSSSWYEFRYGDSFGWLLTNGNLSIGSNSNLALLYHSFSISSDLKSVSLNIDGSFSYSNFTPVHDVFDLSSDITNVAISGKSLVSLVTSDIDSIGWVYVNNYSKFEQAVKQGEIEKNEQVTSIPLTGVENTIGNMGLAGVGSGATKGTVSVNSKTKDITVTNEATKEAELVIEQGNAGDIDLPDNDTIIDKFPFSLPFDLYRILTIFVVPEQKPVFKFPIETTITNGGLNYKIDEEIEVDLTRFQFMGQDIVRLVLRSTFYVGFVIMLIHVTSKFIKH